MNVAIVAEHGIGGRGRRAGRGAVQLFGTMAGRRSLTHEEERRLLRVLRRMHARDRALITAQWLTGFRISEILSLTVGAVFRHGAVVEKSASLRNI